MPAVSLIIVSWNVQEALAKNLERLLYVSAHVVFEIIVVDNGSHDGTPTMLRTRFPRVHLIQNDTNRGFAYACNQGLKVATGEVLVLFNPDMLMGNGVIDYTYELLKSQQDIGILGVALKKPDGRVVASVRRDPQITDQLAILLKLAKLFPSLTNRYLATDFDYTQSQEVEQLRGSYFAFRRDVYENVGELDADNFFIWFEEVDYCRRVRKAGYKIWYSAEVSCTDLVGQSFKQQRLALKQARFSRSMAQYFLKWHSVWQGGCILVLRPFVIVAAWVVDVFGHQTV
jgi:GT2 family glycosyltransferase